MTAKLKTIVCMVMAVMFVIGMAGCGNNAKDAADSPTEKPADTSLKNTGTEDNATPEPTIKPTPELTFDLGGRTIRFANWWNQTLTEKGVSEANDIVADFEESLMKKYNFTMEYVTDTDKSTNLITSVMAGDPMADITFVDTRYLFPGIITNNILIPWDTLKYIDATDDKWDTVSTEAATYKGKVYGSAVKPFYVRGVMFWNKTMFEREGQESIYPLMQNKQWTWEKMREICKALTKDEDNDGTYDYFGLAGGEDLTGLIIYSNNAKTVYFDEAGKPIFDYGNTNTLEALQYLQDLVIKDKSFTPQGSRNWDYHRNLFTDGKVGIIGTQRWISGSINDTMSDEYGYALPPMGPKASEYVSCANYFNIEGFPQGIKEPDMVAFVYDKWRDRAPGITDEMALASYEQAIKDDESYELLTDIAMGITPTRLNIMQHFTGLVNMSYSFMSRIINDGESPKAVIDEVAPMAQQTLDDLFAD